MKGLRASHFRRIHKGLRLDLILTVAGPVIFLVLASLLEKQMSAAGVETAGITADAALSFPKDCKNPLPHGVRFRSPHDFCGFPLPLSLRLPFLPLFFQLLELPANP